MVYIAAHGVLDANDWTVTMLGEPAVHFYAPPGQSLAGPTSLDILRRKSFGQSTSGVVVYPDDSGNPYTPAGGYGKVYPVPNLQLGPLQPDERDRVLRVLAVGSNVGSWLNILDAPTRLCTGDCADFTRPFEGGNPNLPHRCDGLLGRFTADEEIHLVVCSSFAEDDDAPSSILVAGEDKALSEEREKYRTLLAMNLQEEFATEYVEAMSTLLTVADDDRVSLEEYDPIKFYKRIAKCFTFDKAAECAAEFVKLDDVGFYVKDTEDRPIYLTVCEQYFDELDDAEAAEFLSALKAADGGGSKILKLIASSSLAKRIEDLEFERGLGLFDD